MCIFVEGNASTHRAFHGAKHGIQPCFLQCKLWSESMFCTVRTMVGAHLFKIQTTVGVARCAWLQGWSGGWLSPTVICTVQIAVGDRVIWPYISIRGPGVLMNILWPETMVCWFNNLIMMYVCVKASILLFGTITAHGEGTVYVPRLSPLTVIKDMVWSNPLAESLK